MDPRPASRRQFLGTAAAVVAAPFTSAPLPAAPHSPPLPEVPEPPLPPGVARQFGSARFRDLSAVRGKFSADSRWLIDFDETKGVCAGYQIATGRKVRFTIPRRDTDWAVDRWLVTTDGRLTAVERRGTDYRVRRFDLMSGAEAATVTVDGRVTAVSADGRTAVLETQRGGEQRCWAVDLGSGGRRWEPREVPQVHTLEQTGRLIASGVRVGDGNSDYPLKLLEVTTGRTTAVEPPPGSTQYTTHTVWSADDGRRVVAHLVARTDDLRVCTWDARTGRLVGSFAMGERERVIGPTADGRGVFATDGDEAQLVVRDVTNGKVVRRLPVADVGAAGSAVTPDGKVILVARPPGSSNTPDSPVRLIDADTGRLLPQSPDPPGPLTRVWFPGANVVGASYRPPDEHAIADDIRDFAVWNVPSGRGWRVSNPNRDDDVASVGSGMSFDTFSPDGESMLRLVKGKLTSLDARTHRPRGRYDGKGVKPHLFWADADTVVMFDEAAVVTWKPSTAATTTTPLAFEVKDPHITSPRMSADGTVVALGVWDINRGGQSDTLGWLDVRTGKTTTVREGGLEVRGLRVSADGTRVAFPYLLSAVDPERWAVEESGGFVVRCRDGRRFRIPTEREHKLYDLTRCGRAVVAERQADKSDREKPAIELWEVATGGLRWRYPLDKAVSDLRASPCGRYFATVRADTPLYLWDIYGETTDPRPTPAAADLPRLWDALNVSEADKAFAAVRTLVQHPAAAVELLGANLQPVTKPSPQWVALRIDRLSAPEFHRRHSAERELAEVADLIGDELAKAMDDGGISPEAGERLAGLVEKAGRPSGVLRIIRSVEVLEYAGGKAVTDLLTRLAGGAEGATLTREASAALRRRRWRG